MIKLIIAALLGIAGAAAHAESRSRPCTDKPESAYLSLDALKAKVAERGYEIQNAEIKNACAEIHALDKTGARADLFIDPTSGMIVSEAGAKAKAAQEADEDSDENEAGDREDSD